MPRKTPRRADQGYLERVALFYLERYATSRENLRRYLMRKVQESARAHGTDAEQGAQWVAALLDKLVRNNLLDDRRFAAARARTLQRQGRALGAVRMGLQLKGVTADEAERAVESLRDEIPNADLRAAVALARRRRFGPFGPAADPRERQRQTAAMARRGFSLEVIRRVLGAESADAAEALADAD
jgi:regulatory protein